MNNEQPIGQPVEKSVLKPFYHLNVARVEPKYENEMGFFYNIFHDLDLDPNENLIDDPRFRYHSFNKVKAAYLYYMETGRKPLNREEAIAIIADSIDEAEDEYRQFGQEEFDNEDPGITKFYRIDSSLRANIQITRILDSDGKSRATRLSTFVLSPNEGRRPIKKDIQKIVESGDFTNAEVASTHHTIYYSEIANLYWLASIWARAGNIALIQNMYDIEMGTKSMIPESELTDDEESNFIRAMRNMQKSFHRSNYPYARAIARAFLRYSLDEEQQQTARTMLRRGYIVETAQNVHSQKGVSNPEDIYDIEGYDAPIKEIRFRYEAQMNEYDPVISQEGRVAYERHTNALFKALENKYFDLTKDKIWRKDNRGEEDSYKQAISYLITMSGLMYDLIRYNFDDPNYSRLRNELRERYDRWNNISGSGVVEELSDWRENI